MVPKSKKLARALSQSTSRTTTTAITSSAA